MINYYVYSTFLQLKKEGLDKYLKLSKNESAWEISSRRGGKQAIGRAYARGRSATPTTSHLALIVPSFSTTMWCFLF